MKGGTTYGRGTVHRVQVRPTECLDLTSLNLDEFQSLVPLKAMFQVHMAV